MSPFTQLLTVLGLGAFWGFSPALNKILGQFGLPVSHILVFSGLGVGLGLMLLQRLMGERLQFSWRILAFGLGCGVLLNIPWFGSLTVVRHVPITITAVIISTSPLWTYALALLLRRESASLMRLAALAVGFLSSLIVIVTRAPEAGIAAAPMAFGIDGWILLTMTLPILYAFYNVFASMAWPKGMTAMTAGVIESFCSALLALPLLPLLEPLALSGINSGYWLLLAATAMWVIERVCFFTLIQRAGPVTTVQAVYVGTPAAVVFGLVLFGEPMSLWLGISLALLMLALWLNNRALAAARAVATAPSEARATTLET